MEILSQERIIKYNKAKDIGGLTGLENLLSTILDKLYEIKVREVKDSEGKVKSELLSAYKFEI